MSNIWKILVQEMSKSSGSVKIVSKDYKEWIAWLNYESEFEKQRKNYLMSRKFEELNKSEQIELSHYIKYQTYANLFNKYETNTCTQEEYIKVCNFMKIESLEDLITSKLTVEELVYVKSEINRIENLSSADFESEYRKLRDSYFNEQLTMAERYVYYLSSRIAAYRSHISAENEISAQLKENEDMRYRSYIYSQNPYRKLK